MVVATYILAPLPNWICGRCANPDDFSGDGGGNAILDFGKFCTGFLVAMGIGRLPLLRLSLGGMRGSGRRDLSPKLE